MAYRESFTSHTVEKWPQLREIGAGRGRRGEDVPELPHDGVPSIFEQVGQSHLEITAIVVVCG